MSKEKSKKVVVTTEKKLDPTKSRQSAVDKSDNGNSLIFGKTNYMIVVLGFALVIIGMLLMTGGHMPSPDVWDDNHIYGFRRTVLAPIIILTGLAIDFYAIFKK